MGFHDENGGDVSVEKLRVSLISMPHSARVRASSSVLPMNEIDLG